MSAVYKSILVLSLTHTLFRWLRVFKLGERRFLHWLGAFVQELNKNGVSEIHCLARLYRFHDCGLAEKQGWFLGFFLGDRWILMVRSDLLSDSSLSKHFVLRRVGVALVHSVLGAILELRLQKGLISLHLLLGDFIHGLLNLVKIL